MISKNVKSDLSIYIHIPFCIKKCLYCDFISVKLDEEMVENYVAALCKELQLAGRSYETYRVVTIFIGGGTPTAIPAPYIEKIMYTLKNNFTMSQEIEISIEANPGTVDKKKLVSYRKAGINRISIGAQSLSNKELVMLGRIHSAEEFFETFTQARQVGFTNINVDIMEALPGQTKEDLEQTLHGVISLMPEHISAYSLIVEEETPFFQMVKDQKLPPLPSEEEDRKMDRLTEKLLQKSGYHRYEISNYAKPGRECKHNRVYWERGHYLGIGAGAASMIENCRWNNIKDIERYTDLLLQSDKQTVVHEGLVSLSIGEQMEEFMFLGLRLTQGVSKKKFASLYYKTVEQVYGELPTKLCKEGLIENTEDMKLTAFGRDVSNYVMSQFMML